jgi:hypothetical protein
MAQAGSLTGASVGPGAGESLGAALIAMSMTAQPSPVHCGQAASTHVFENRNRRSG